MYSRCSGVVGGPHLVHYQGKRSAMVIRVKGAHKND